MHHAHRTALAAQYGWSRAHGTPYKRPDTHTYIHTHARAHRHMHTQAHAHMHIQHARRTRINGLAPRGWHEAAPEGGDAVRLGEVRDGARRAQSSLLLVDGDHLHWAVQCCRDGAGAQRARDCLALSSIARPPRGHVLKHCGRRAKRTRAQYAKRKACGLGGHPLPNACEYALQPFPRGSGAAATSRSDSCRSQQARLRELHTLARVVHARA